MAAVKKAPVQVTKPAQAPKVAAGALKPVEQQGKKQKSSKNPFRNISKTTALTIAIVIFGGIALFTAIIVVAHNNNIRNSRVEYEQLRELAGDIEEGEAGHGTVQLSALDLEMLQINPDYIGWLRIDGTNIDYPVVRGTDNDKYLNTSFSGEDSKAGAIFMDYRNFGDPIPHIIIYGHNLQQGGMFTDLRSFLFEQFLNEHNIITLIINDEIMEFEIFSARLTDIEDPAYYLDFSEPRNFPRFADKIEAPLQATQIITLSTCTRGGSDDRRIVVQGYRLLD